MDLDFSGPLRVLLAVIVLLAFALVITALDAWGWWVLLVAVGFGIGVWLRGLAK